MGGVTHYLCEGLRAELPSHAKPLFLPVLVLTLFPLRTVLTHLHRHVFSDVRVPLCRLYLYALSSSGPFVFPGVVVSCSPSLLGWEAGREGLGCGLWLSAQPVGLVNWGNVQEAIGLSPLGEGPAPHVGY